MQEEKDMRETTGTRETFSLSGPELLHLSVWKCFLLSGLVSVYVLDKWCRWTFSTSGLFTENIKKLIKTLLKCLSSCLDQFSCHGAHPIWKDFKPDQWPNFHRMICWMFVCVFSTRPLTPANSCGAATTTTRFSARPRKVRHSMGRSVDQGRWECGCHQTMTSS